MCKKNTKREKISHNNNDQKDVWHFKNETKTLSWIASVMIMEVSNGFLRWIATGSFDFAELKFSHLLPQLSMKLSLVWIQGCHFGFFTMISLIVEAEINSSVFCVNTNLRTNGYYKRHDYELNIH